MTMTLVQADPDHSLLLTAEGLANAMLALFPALCKEGRE